MNGTNDRRSALDEWQAAQAAFNWAQPDYIDAAIYALRAAEERLRAEVAQARADRMRQRAGATAS